MLAFLKLIALVWVAAISRPMQGDADEILAQLSDLRLDKNQIHSIRDVTIRRDVISLSFNRGTIAFLEPVGGRVTGAVFVGTGDVLVIPPNDIERRQLNKFTGSPILNEEFNAAVIRFTDETYEEMLRIMGDRASEDVRTDELEALLPLDQNLGEVSFLQNFRILTEYLGNGEMQFFSSILNGKTLGWFDVVYDTVSAEEVYIASSRAASVPGPADIWASFNKRSEARDPGGATSAGVGSLDVRSYDIDTTIEFDGELEVTAVVNVLPNRSGQRALTFNMSRTLRVGEIRLEGRPLQFFQHPEILEFPDHGGLNEIVVVLPVPAVAGQGLTLEFSYEGYVLERRGRGIYFVNERSQWYPGVGSGDSALYDLTFHYPASNTLVATGRKEQELDTEGIRHSRWKSAQELFRAGFNYGDFSIASDESGAVSIDVYVNNDIDAVYQELQSILPAQSRESLGAFLGSVPLSQDQQDQDDAPSEYELYSRRSLATNILEEVRSAIDVYSEYFGPYPFERVSVSQFPVGFSEGWPSLLYVSTLPFLDPQRRERLGFDDADVFLDMEFDRAREIAHQWFGNTVGWQTYRDQWLIEGLANYASVLYMEDQPGGVAQAGDVLIDLKRRLLTATGKNGSGDATTPDDQGPVSLGPRLVSSQSTNGFAETVQTKSTWILHMLRHLMSGSVEPVGSPGSDGPFLLMIREFVLDTAHRAVSTRDFKAVAERHMTDRMDVEGDQTLDWFFDQWVFRTGIPHYEITYDIQDSLDGFVASGRITESDLTNFVMPVPVYSRTVTGIQAYLGDVVVDGDSGEFSFYVDERPADIVLDPYDTILRKP